MDAVPDGLEARLRWLFGGVAVVLVATGAFALLVTSTTEPVQMAQTSLASIDAQLRALLIATLAGFVAAMTMIGARVVWSPRGNTHLMPVLALVALAGFACVTSTALEAWRAGAAWQEPAIVAASSLMLALASALGWLALWLAERPGLATARRDAALFDALLATLVPAGEGLELDAQDPTVRARIVAAFAARSTGRRPALRLALRTLDALSMVKHRRRFDAADQAVREQLVAGLATSRRPRLRALGVTLDEVVLGAFWSDARVRSAVGDDAARVAALLESGPNAAAHRARREAAEAAAREAELADASALDDASSDAADGAAPALDVAPGAPVAPFVDAGPRADAAAGNAAPLAAQETAASDGGAPAPAPSVPVTEVAPGASATPGDAPRTTQAAKPPGDGPREIAPHTEELPFDRPWTIGVPAQEATPRPAIGPVLRVARSGGPTRR